MMDLVIGRMRYLAKEAASRLPLVVVSALPRYEHPVVLPHL